MARKAQPKRNATTVIVKGGIPDELKERVSGYAWRYIHCAGFNVNCKSCGKEYRFKTYKWFPGFRCQECGSSEFGDKRFHHFENVECACPPGPQETTIRLAATGVDEIAAGGGRGSTKTEAGYVLSVLGSPSAEKGSAVAQSRLNHPKYRFLVLRKNSKDLEDCFRRAREFYGAMGGIPTESPTMKITFPSGAEGVFDHMADENAYEKYQGQEFQFIWCEELTQIPSEKLYTRIMNSCRSSFHELRPLKYVTANPSGPGLNWFVRRFVDLCDKDGKPLKNGDVYSDPQTGLKRAFVHSTVYDNPYFLRGEALYLKQLEAEPDEYERRKWLLGDFHSAEGQYFTAFRPKGPFPHEAKDYPWARHVYDPSDVELLPYWYRWIGMDWGFAHNGAVYWACQHPNSQVFIYRELVREGMGAEEWGVAIAEESIRDLEGVPDRIMTVYLSPDAFAKRSAEKPISEQIAWGIQRVLGPNSSKVLTAEDLSGDRRVYDVRQFQIDAGIVIRPANNQRIAGWQYMHSLMRFKPLFDQSMKPELLPKLQISSACRNLIEKIPTAVRDVDHNADDVMKVDGDDEIDSARYLLMGHRDLQNSRPKEYFMQERLDAAKDKYTDPAILQQIARKAQADWDKQASVSSALMVPNPFRRWRM